jgi:hypothetical protein
MPMVRSIVVRINHSALSLQALLEENRGGEESVYDEANDWYDWSRVHPGQVERAELIVRALQSVAKASLQREYPGAVVDIECAADATPGIEVDPGSVEDAVGSFVDTNLAKWIDEAWLKGLGSTS